MPATRQPPGAWLGTLTPAGKAGMIAAIALRANFQVATLKQTLQRANRFGAMQSTACGLVRCDRSLVQARAYIRMVAFVRKSPAR